METIGVVGAGIGGLCTAIALHQKGFNVTVFEHSLELKPVGAGLILATNAMKALAVLKLAEVVQSHGKALRQFRLESAAGIALSVSDSQASQQRYGVAGNYALHRADLQALLLAQLPLGTVQLGKRYMGLHQDANGVEIQFADGTTARTDLLIACDGVHSAMRQHFLPASRPRYAGYTCWRGVASLLPALGLPNDVAAEAWGHRGRLGMVPLTNDRVYWYACLNAAARDTQLAQAGPLDLARLFRHHLPGRVAVLAATPVAQITHHDIIDVPPIRQFVFGRVVLLGDAAHAMTPNLGQGACQAIEDAVVLANCLAVPGPYSERLHAYERRRLPRTTQLVQRSWQIGKVAQWENRGLVFFRNALLRYLPAALNEQQQIFLNNVDFSS